VRHDRRAPCSECGGNLSEWTATVNLEHLHQSAIKIVEPGAFLSLCHSSSFGLSLPHG
jgi:hypothetical protein